MFISLVQAEHFNVPGVPTAAYLDPAAAAAKALELVNVIRVDVGLPEAPADADWRAALVEAQRTRIAEEGSIDAEELADLVENDPAELAVMAECDVWIEEHPLKIPHLAPDTEIVLAPADQPSCAGAMLMLLGAMKGERAEWAKRQAPDGADNDDFDQEEADTAVEILDRYIQMIGDRPLPRVIVVLEGGALSTLVSDIPLDATLLDYDTDGDADDEVVNVPQPGAVPYTAAARRVDASVEINPAFITDILALPTVAACMDMDAAVEESEIEAPEKWLVSAEIGIPGPDGGFDSWSGYFAADTADQALEAARRVIRHIYAEGVRIFSMKAVAPAAKGEQA